MFSLFDRLSQGHHYEFFNIRKSLLNKYGMVSKLV